MATPDGLIAFGTQIPVINLVGDIANNGGVHVIEGNAVFVGREEAVIGLGEHGGKGQGVAFTGVDDKGIGAARKRWTGAISANRRRRYPALGIGKAHRHVIAIMTVCKDAAATDQQQHCK